MFLAKKLNKGAGTSTPTPDPQFNYVTMLLHGDGTNGAQNNTFLDSSTNNFTITRNGNTTQGSFSPYGSNWSNYFNGTGYLNTANTSAFKFGTGDFTVEFWAYFIDQGTGTYNAITSMGANSLNIQNQFGNFNVQYQGISNVITFSLTSYYSSWNHFAVVRQSGTTKVYINGSVVATNSDASDYQGSDALNIGLRAGGGYLNSYISNFRVCKAAVYTSTFTPSTTPLTTTSQGASNCTMLMCQSNRFIDNSASALVFTVGAGTPSVQRFNPFGASTAYSTSVIGGSGYFDGSGDYLTLASGSTFSPSGNYLTVEAWVYATGAAGDRTVFSRIQDGSPYSGYDLRVDGGTAVSIDAGGQTTTSSISCVANTWNYVVWQFDASGNRQIYVNGVRGLNTTGASTSVDYNNTPRIGAGVSNGSNWAGYISELRIIKQSTAYYTTSTITVPTAPLTAVTNTQLLLNYTNGAIFDNAMMNDLETVGNAQISTSVVKYGTGSLAFDETGDYITVPPSTNMSLGTGDFTIECWVRFAANPVGNGQGLYQLTNGYLNSTIRGPACGVENSTGGWTIYYGTTYTISGTVPTTGVWYHTAFVRSSGTSKLYINGTSIISVADTTNYTDQYFTIGGYYSTAFLLNGYIDDLRITKGYARYTANFTPPTAAFPNTGPN